MNDNSQRNPNPTFKLYFDHYFFGGKRSPWQSRDRL